MSDGPLLEVTDLEKHYPITEGLLRRETGRVRAVDGVSFSLDRGETLGLVGESGCGKSTTALSVLRLEEPTGGEVRFDGQDVSEFGRRELRAYRRNVQLVLQDPDTAFNPRRTVGQAVAEPLRVHGLADGDRRREIVEDTLERVGLAAENADGYPHEFSGGEKQRIAIARALVLNPDVVIADEPVSALDGRTKAEVLGLLDDLQDRFGLAVLLISHDLDLVRRFCDRLAVMYLGSIVERGPAAEVSEVPQHPYTQVLLSSLPSLDAGVGETVGGARTGEPPDASDVPSGCRFHPRCPAIIQPEAVSLPREQWLDVVALAVHLRDDWADADGLLASLPDGDGDGQGVEARLRAAFDLPETVADERVDEAIAGAAAALAGGDLDAARGRLDGVVSGVCEAHDPDLSDAHTPHEVACHRYDPTVPGAPETGIEVRDAED